MRIKKLSVYEILNSEGKPAVEAEIITEKGTTAVASVSSAIVPGRREVHRTENHIKLKQEMEFLVKDISCMEITQEKVDKVLAGYMVLLGSDICLAISLACARATALERGISLCRYLKEKSLRKSQRTIPISLATVFSGGVHDNEQSIQNIMLSVKANTFIEVKNIILDIYGQIEKKMIERGALLGYGKSSGMIVHKLTSEEKFEIISEEIFRRGVEKQVSLAIDVAAEHLELGKKGFYKYEGKIIDSSGLMDIITLLKERYPVTFIEDPFGSEDTQTWRQFLKCHGDISVAGDDLFATQACYLDNELANSVIIKMNQAGTLSETLHTVEQARKLGMKTCVSHRSMETEDTFMCDLAIAIGSEYIKIGGPRRGDRIIKYNRILRLEREGELG